MTKTTTGGGLKSARGKRTVASQPGRPIGLADELRADRLSRRLTWPKYAALLGVKLSTLHKIAMGVHQPTELTEAIIRDTLGGTR
jgi:hypothetical protein